MRYAIFQKVSAKMDVAQIDVLHKRLIKKHQQDKLNTGQRLLYIDTKVYDQDGDNFVRQLLTIVSEFDMYKIPRFVKHFILRKK